MADQTDVKQFKLDQTTRLAFERTRLAHGTTLMSWVRTATSLITFGFTFYKFFQFEIPGVDRSGQLVSPRAFGLMMITIGLLSLLFGTIEYYQAMKQMRKQCVDLPRSMAGISASLITLLGMLALFAVIFRH